MLLVTIIIPFDKTLLLNESIIGSPVLYVKAILLCESRLLPIEMLYELEKYENNITGRSAY